MATNTATEERSSESLEQPKRDFRKEVTEQIIEMLEKGTAPWQKPWEPGAIQLPFNPTTERNYRGGNAIHLMAVAVRKGYDDPRWLTYKQAQEQGWQVKQGERGSPPRASAACVSAGAGYWAVSRVELSGVNMCTSLPYG